MEKLSVVVIVKNDPSALVTIDKLINHKSRTQFEIILVPRLKTQNEDTVQYPGVNVIGYFNKVKEITIPEQRNIGVKAASGAAIVFIDASCIPNHGWLDHLYDEFTNGEEIVSGFVRTEDGNELNSISGEMKKPDYLEECPTANVLISKSVFDKIGMFDEQFEYGSDTDFMWRARDAGIKIRYSINSVVSHDFGGVREQLKRSFRYGKARTRLFLKHPHRLRTVMTKDPVFFFYPLFILFLPLAFANPYYLALILVPLIKNVGRSPLKTLMYNLVFGLGVLYEFLLVIARFRTS